MGVYGVVVGDGLFFVVVDVLLMDCGEFGCVYWFFVWFEYGGFCVEWFVEVVW